MSDLILVVGLAWWLGGAYVGTRLRLRSRAEHGVARARAARCALHVAAAAALLAMVALGLCASARIAAADAGFAPAVFGAVVCAIAAGAALGAARA